MASSKSNPKALAAPTLAAIVLIVMVALYGIDKFLASEEQMELAYEAESHFRNGQQLMRDGKPDRALMEFDRAHTLKRGNRQYTLALAEAQIAAHDFASARTNLNDLLDEDSNEGRVNLLMARLLTAEGQFEAADSYYHRAIYGRWPAGAASEPAKVRLELARVLADHGNSRELLSELLLLQNSSDQNPEARKVIPALFLRAGSAQRAADAYRQLIRDDQAGIDDYIGLADAEVLNGDYRAAEKAMILALRKQPYNQRIQAQFRRVVALASLDPTLRRLSTAEKYRRSAEILKRVQDCAGLEAKPPSGPVTNEEAEALLDQAEELWKDQGGSCRAKSAPDDPLPLLLKKLM